MGLSGCSCTSLLSKLKRCLRPAAARLADRCGLRRSMRCVPWARGSAIMCAARLCCLLCKVWCVTGWQLTLEETRGSLGGIEKLVSDAASSGAAGMQIQVPSLGGGRAVGRPSWASEMRGARRVGVVCCMSMTRFQACCTLPQACCTLPGVSHTSRLVAHFQGPATHGVREWRIIGTSTLSHYRRVVCPTLRGPVPTSHYSGPGGLAAGLSSPLARSHNERPLSAANSATLLTMRAAHSMVPAATLRPDE